MNPDFTTSFRRDVLAMRELVKSEFSVSRKHFYIDLGLSSFTGWIFLVLAAKSPFSGFLFWLSITIAMLAHYRALSFIHEVAHFRDKVPGLEKMYNLMIGFWYGIPSYTHFTHNDHHNPVTFGRKADPEYAEWAHKHPAVVLRPFLFSIMAPLVIHLRFGLLPLVTPFLGKATQKNIFRRFSTFAMQNQYERKFIAEEFYKGQIEDQWTTLFFFVRLGIAVFILPSFLICQILLMVGLAFLNSYRAMVAHRYQVRNSRQQTVGGIEAYRDQVLDSVTIEGRWWTELWAPISLRYHSLHHLFPLLPYHSLASAHLKLKTNLPAAHFYFQTVEPSFFSALSKLYKNCLNRTKAQVTG